MRWRPAPSDFLSPPPSTFGLAVSRNEGTDPETAEARHQLVWVAAWWCIMHALPRSKQRSVEECSVHMRNRLLAVHSDTSDTCLKREGFGWLACMGSAGRFQFAPPETTAVALRGRQCPRNLHVIAFQAISLVHAFNSALRFTETLSITVIVCNYVVHTISFHEEAGQIA